MERPTIQHLHGAAAIDCDHWHDNAGIMTHHLAFTLELEQSLQSVDASVSVPYWDYSYDAYYYNASKQTCGSDCIGGDWTESIIWDDDWFGPIPNA